MDICAAAKTVGENSVRFRMNLIAAVCANGGIGKAGDLPWRLKKEYKYFADLTTKTRDPSKINAVLLGRKCWESIPASHRPLKNRINIVMSRSLVFSFSEKPDGAHYLCRSMDDVVQLLTSAPLCDDVETIWNCGGHDIYKVALDSSFALRIFMTRVLAEFDCDTFFPQIDLKLFRQISVSDIPEDIQEENGIQYKFEVYERHY